MSQIDTILTLIAQKHLGIDTLQTRHADSLDFHDTAVWCIRDALEAAFKAGVELGAAIPKATVMAHMPMFEHQKAIRPVRLFQSLRPVISGRA